MPDLQRTSPVREDLCRSAPFTLTRAVDEGSDGLTIEGYGAVFNSPTRISGWEGDFEESIAPGAFKKSLREQRSADGRSRLRMQFDHGQHPLLGSLPLGRWTIAEEDERGLHLVGRLTDNWLVTPFRDAIMDGGVDGMSFRFGVTDEEWRDAQGNKLRENELIDLLYNGAGDRGPIRRTLRQVRVSEAGPVVWPAYQDTAVGVRSAGLEGRGTVVIDLARLREPAQRRHLAEITAIVEAAVRDADVTPKISNATGDPTPPGAVKGEHGPELLRLDTSKPTGGPTPPGAVKGDPPAPEPDTTPKSVEVSEAPSEPQPTASAADPHPATEAAPEVTDRAAGEHSAPPARPVNPFERRDLIRREFRSYTNRVLALPRHQHPEGESA